LLIVIVSQLNLSPLRGSRWFGHRILGLTPQEQGIQSKNEPLKGRQKITGRITNVRASSSHHKKAARTCLLL